jgi:anti-sigma factor RsiW
MSKRQKFLPDIELLSAYLDGQLSPHQRSAVEARLRAEPALVTELNNLRITRQMLRSLPRLRAPRNFTLTAQSLPKSSPARLPALFGGVSALSSALLIMLVIGGLLMRNRMTPAILDKESLAYPVVKEITTPVEDIALLAQLESTSEAEELALAVPPSADTSRNIAPTLETSVDQPVAETALPTNAFEEELSLGIQVAPTPTPLAYEVALPGMTVGAAGGESLPEEAAAKAPEVTRTAEVSPLESTLFTSELILAGIALLSGLTSLFLMIRQRK